MRSTIRFFSWSLIGAISFSGCQSEQQSPKDALQPKPFRATVVVAQAQVSSELVPFTGTVTARKRATIAARISATVVATHANLGDRVRRGAPLVTLDRATAEAQVQQAEGALRQAEAAYELALRNSERFERLFSQQAATALELDQARMELERARGAMEQARGALRAAESLAQDTLLKAPFDAAVVKRWVEVGDLVAPGRPLFELESLSGRRLEVAVPESWLSLGTWSVGTAQRARFPSHPELGEFSVTLVELSPGPSPASRNFLAVFELPDSIADWVPAGSEAQLLLERQTAPRVLVPAEAIVNRGGLDLVVLRSPEGLAITRPVRLGQPRSDGSVPVLSGLEGGETLARTVDQLPEAGARFEVTP